MTVLRKSGTRIRSLDSLAVEGLGDDHIFLKPSEAPEEIHRLLVRRSIPASEEAWRGLCPRPRDWKADE
jgi:hypothetical protein